MKATLMLLWRNHGSKKLVIEIVVCHTKWLHNILSWAIYVQQQNKVRTGGAPG